MVLDLSDRSDYCNPVLFVDGDGEGGRLGGRPPVGVAPKRADLKYFASVVIKGRPGVWASIFVADFDEILDCGGRVNPLGAVEVVVHSPSPRVLGSAYDSELTECGVRVLDAVVDVMEMDPGVYAPLDWHKIGGRPFLLRGRPAVRSATERLLEDGYLLVLQVAFPSIDDAVEDGDWPFGDGMFALFGRAPFGWGDWFWSFEY